MARIEFHCTFAASRRLTNTRGSRRFPLLFIRQSSRSNCSLAIVFMELTERITQLLEEKFTTDTAFSDCFTVDIELKPGNRLAVFLDSDSGMTFEKCQKISRHLESYLDANNWLGPKYVLEVSSPGIGRPLKFLRQYRNNIGRKAAITLKDGSTEKGTLHAVDDNQVILMQNVTEKQGKKKVQMDVGKAFTFDQIEKAVIKAAF